MPNKKLVYQQVIAGGCANINVKIRFAGDDTLFILRIYLRDKEAVYREKEISKSVKKQIQMLATQIFSFLYPIFRYISSRVKKMIACVNHHKYSLALT